MVEDLDPGRVRDPASRRGRCPDDSAVDAHPEAVRRPCGRARPAIAVIGGGVGPVDASSQVTRAGGGGLLLARGSAAYAHPGGLTAGLAATVEALAR
ncbi:MAG: hypothetical protein M3O23_08650 [Actinomycetota bacterium]|nr:hypothetical protein [Actinomycetota bacterium]